MGTITSMWEKAIKANKALNQGSKNRKIEKRKSTVKRYLILTGLVLMVFLMSIGTAFAASTPDFTQTISAGTLTTDILDASRVTVASPSAALTAKTFSFSCQSGGSASTGTLGTSSQRLYVMNPSAAANGFTLTIAATSGATSKWANTGVTRTYDFNDSGTSGCSDGADADSISGQLTIDPSAGTLTTDCLSCTSTNITKGSSSAFVQGTTDSVTLLNAAAGSDDVWRGYLTGATLSQTIPAEQAPDSYSINLTVTVTAS